MAESLDSLWLLQVILITEIEQRMMKYTKLEWNRKFSCPLWHPDDAIINSSQSASVNSALLPSLSYEQSCQGFRPHEFYRATKRETKLVSMLSFVQGTVWRVLFGKQADSLEKMYGEGESLGGVTLRHTHGSSGRGSK